MLDSMKKKRPNFARFTFLLTACCIFCGTAIGDIVHITSDTTAVAPGATVALNWNVDADTGSTTVDFIFSYDPDGDIGGSRDLNFFDPDSNPAPDPLPTGQVITTRPDAFGQVLIVGLPSLFLIDDTLPDHLMWSSEVAPVTSGSNALAGLDGFSIDTPGYFGFRFQSGSTTLYGWGKLTVTAAPVDGDGVPTGAPGLTISEWAYEDSGGPLSVPVPEPTTTALLSAGAAGMLLRHRRRRKSVPPQDSPGTAKRC